MANATDTNLEPHVCSVTSRPLRNAGLGRMFDPEQRSGGLTYMLTVQVLLNYYRTALFYIPIILDLSNIGNLTGERARSVNPHSHDREALILESVIAPCSVTIITTAY
jgi:hypothetical protein